MRAIHAADGGGGETTVKGRRLGVLRTDPATRAAETLSAGRWEQYGLGEAAEAVWGQTRLALDETSSHVGAQVILVGGDDHSPQALLAALAVAIGASRAGLATCLVDASMERPSLENPDEGKDQHGFAELLLGAEADRVAHAVPGLELRVVPPGAGSRRLLNRMKGGELRAALDALRALAEVVVVAAPLSIEGKANPLAPHVNGVVWVRTPGDAVEPRAAARGDVLSLGTIEADPPAAEGASARPAVAPAPPVPEPVEAVPAAARPTVTPELLAALERESAAAPGVVWEMGRSKRASPMRLLLIGTGVSLAGALLVVLYLYQAGSLRLADPAERFGRRTPPAARTAPRAAAPPVADRLPEAEPRPAAGELAAESDAPSVPLADEVAGEMAGEVAGEPPGTPAAAAPAASAPAATVPAATVPAASAPAAGAAPAADPAKAAPAPSAAVPGPEFVVYVASFKVARSAEAEAQAVRDGGYQAEIWPVDLPVKGRWYRVVAGRFATREQAQALIDELKRGGRWRDPVLARR